MILVFDEAHVLTKSDEFDLWTNFGELRRALRTLNNRSLVSFFFFLSTTGRITQFVPTREKDASMRVLQGGLKLIKPFTDLGFDPLVSKKLKAGSLTLPQVTTEEFMVQFGRPL